VPLYYFVTEKGMSLDESDNRGSTPLHWACYSRSEFALSYILALNPNLELQDNSGFTALHLAIKSVPELKTTRPVRALLIRGAKRSPVSKAGLTSI
jgi:ankyrin repeat protein